jgi:hypothetical protein
MTAAQIDTENSSSVHLIFKVMNKNYLPSNSILNQDGNEYPGIKRIKLYGYNKEEGLKKVTKLVNNQKQDLSSDQFSYNEKKGIITLHDINLVLGEDTTLIFI